MSAWAVTVAIIANTAAVYFLLMSNRLIMQRLDRHGRELGLLGARTPNRGVAATVEELSRKARPNVQDSAEATNTSGTSPTSETVTPRGTHERQTIELQAFESRPMRFLPKRTQVRRKGWTE